VPPNAAMAVFQILGGGGVSLYANYGLPLPNSSRFDYESVSDSTYPFTASQGNQAIVVTTNTPWTTNTAPAPLKPGTWYLNAAVPPNNNSVVYNEIYTIVATVYTNLNIIPLNAHPVTGSRTYFSYVSPAQPPGFTNVFYSFTNASSDRGIAFTVSALSGDADLLVGSNCLPSPQEFFAGSFEPGTNTEVIDFPVRGTHVWYLAAPNETSGNITYIVTAEDLSTPVTSYPSVSGAGVSANGGFTLTWNSTPGDVYEIDVSTNLVDWMQAAQVTATNTVSSYTDSTPITNQPARYYRLDLVP